MRVRILPSKVQPWDKRGEVYIRYGAPNYRSRSGRTNPPPSMAVQAVKERNAFTIYKESDALPIPGEIAHGRALIEPVFPLDRSARERVDDVYVAEEPTVHWESWVYTQVGGGIEFVFTDQMLNGQWAFAPPPLSANLPIGLMTRLAELNPANVLQVVSSAMPERYTLPPGDRTAGVLLRPGDFSRQGRKYRGGGLLRHCTRTDGRPGGGATVANPGGANSRVYR